MPSQAIAYRPLTAEQLYWLISARRACPDSEVNGFQYKTAYSFIYTEDGRCMEVDHSHWSKPT